MSSRYLNTIKNYSKLDINYKLFDTTFKSNNVSFQKLNAKSYTTWGSSKLTKKHLKLKIIFAGVAGFGIYSIYSFNATNIFSVVTPYSKVLALEDIKDEQFKEYLSIHPTRKIRSSTDNGNIKLTFFQFQSCPFCCKVRAFLDFQGLSYDVVEVNSFTRKEIKWAQGYKKVPILMARHEGTGQIVMLKDSSAIISLMQTSLEHPDELLSSLWEYYPVIESANEKGKVLQEVANRYSIMYGDKRTAPADFLEVRRWREWTDSHFVHTISPNLYRTPSEAFDTFKVFSKVGEWEENFSWLERAAVVVAGSSVMYILGKMLKKRHKLSSDVRQDLYAACDEWMRGVRKVNKGGCNKFMGGLKPNLADLSVYGVLNAMEGTRSFEDALNHSKVGEWFYAVKSEIASNAGKRVGLQGAEARAKVGVVNA